VARCMPAPDRCRAAKKMKAAFPQFRARGLNGGKPRSALLGRPLSACRHRDGAPASFLLLAPRGPRRKRGGQGIGGSRCGFCRPPAAAPRGDAGISAGSGKEPGTGRKHRRATAVLFAKRLASAKDWGAVGNLPRLDRIRLQSVRRPGRSAGNLPPAMAPKNRRTTSAVFTGWEGTE